MSGVYDPLAQRAAEADSQPASANTYDPLALVAAGKPLPAANDSTTPSAPSMPKWESDWLTHGNPVNQFVQGAFDQGIKSTAGAVAGGLKGLWDIATGRSSAAPSDVEQLEQHTAYQPQTPAQEAGATVASSNWNPLNWPGVAISKTGEFLGNTAEKMGAPPWLSTALDVAPAAAASVYGLKGAGIKPSEGYVPEVERVMPEGAASTAPKVEPAAAPDGPPVEGGLPKEAQTERAAILKRVGITQARKSAIEGDAKAAATDYQVNKTDEPAGREATAQFEHERNALTNFTQRQITRVGGSIGTDEDALINRGQTISKPFDDLRQWFRDRTNQLYEQADANAAALRGGAYDTKTGTTSLTNLEGVDKLLNSRTFKNSLAAQDRTSLLNAARDQLDYFRENNPKGFTAKTAEQYRQWLNQQWSPQNSWAIGQLKSAVDDDVLKNAGENVYAQARAMRVLKSKTLDDPKGIAQLFDSDPLTPINRTTPFEKIPDKILSLPAEHFQNLVQTLKEMPPELQSQAQAALGEVRGQLLNRVLKAGTETRTGRGAQLWRGQEVSQTLARHAAKFRIAFQDDPVTQAALKDLNAAGQILHTPEGYPGAQAQAVNLSKRGVGAAIVRQGSRAAGAAAGAALHNPVTAAAGEMVGNAVGEGAAARIDESSALRNWRKRITSLEERP